MNRLFDSYEMCNHGIYDDTFLLLNPKPIPLHRERDAAATPELCLSGWPLASVPHELKE